MNENYQLNEIRDQLQEVMIKLRASEERQKLYEEQIANFLEMKKQRKREKMKIL